MRARILMFAWMALLILPTGSAAVDQHIDPNENIHKQSLTIARHPNTAWTIAASTAGANAATPLVRRCDSRVSATQDVACEVIVEITGAMGTFGTAADGLDVITTAAEMATVLGTATAYVKVVTSINFCGIATGAVGCAPVPGSSICIVNGLSAAVWGETLVHELGHNKGLNHRDAPGKPFMHTSTFGNNEVSATECVAYHGGGTVVGPNHPVDVAFVIDDTGSMGEEIAGVRNSLVTHLATYPATACNAFQLTTFKDVVTSREPTTDLAAIQAQVAGLSASGGGDCPEASVSALLEAATKVKEKGRFFFATDASSQPGFSLEFVISILRALGRRVDVLLTGTCSSAEPEASRVSFNAESATDYVAKPQSIPNPGRNRAIQASGGPVEIFLGDDGFQEVMLPFAFPFGGRDYSSAWVGSNGFVTFGQGTAARDESAVALLGGPRMIAAVWDDLNPGAAGTVTVEDRSGEFWIDFSEVTEFGSAALVSFTIKLRPDGTFAVAYGAIGILDGLAGFTIGGSPSDPGEIDLSKAPQPIGETADGTTYERFSGDQDLSGLTLEYAAVTTTPPRVYTTMEVFSLLAEETGGVFSFFPEINYATASDQTRFENVIFNIVQGGLTESIALVQPPNGPAGSSVTVTMTGAETDFQSSTTVSVSGSGVSVSNVLVLSPKVLRATFTVSPGAEIGFRDIVATTNLGRADVETATGVGAFEVVTAPSIPTILGITPPAVGLGEATTVVVQAAGTSFDASSVLDLGAGVVVESVTPLSATSLQADIRISAGSVVGFRNVSVTTGGTEFATESVTGPFFVSSSPTALPTLASVTPSVGGPGTSFTISISGLNTAFVDGVSVVSFSGSGINVLSTSVSSPTALTAEVEIAAGAALGFRDVRVSTVEVVARLDGFNVTVAGSDLTASPSSVDFGSLGVGSARDEVVRLRNGPGADRAVAITSITLADNTNAAFELVSGTDPITLAANEFQDVTVRYLSDTPGTATATLRIESDDTTRPTLDVALSGTATLGVSRQNFPNPFGGLAFGQKTTIQFIVDEQGGPVPVTLKVFDLQGREVGTLRSELLGPGRYSSDWNGRDSAGELVTAGIYLYRLEIGSKVITRKMTVLR